MSTSVGLLGGYSILVVDDEPFCRHERGAGADVVSAHDLRTALVSAMTGNISAAILDLALGVADSGALCTALKKRHVPFS
jgi:DNA-binding response OmpR family regulator